MFFLTDDDLGLSVQFLTTKAADEPTVWGPIKECFLQSLWYQLLLVVEQNLIKPDLDVSTVQQVYVNIFLPLSAQLNIDLLFNVLVRMFLYLKDSKEKASLATSFYSYPRLESRHYVQIHSLLVLHHLNHQVIQEGLPLSREYGTARSFLVQAETLVEESNIADSTVLFIYYLAEASYQYMIADFDEAFQSYQLLSKHVNWNDLMFDEQGLVAKHAAVSALLSNGFYDYNWLQERSQLMQILKTSIYEWMVSFIGMNTTGAVLDFGKYLHFVNEIHLDKGSQEQLYKKLLDLGVYVVALERFKAARTLTFEDVAAACGVEIDKVEYLVIRVISTKLLCALIDSVNKTITITKVKPLFLDSDKVTYYENFYRRWVDKVQEAC